MYTEALSQLIESALQRTLDTMRQGGPHMAQQAEHWMQTLAGSDHAADYFKHPLAFPMLLLPWWMEQTIRPEPDISFQSDLIYSSINGYYFIRMIDNVMDDHDTIEKKLLPMLGFFHMQFHSTYQTYFEANHPFWGQFQAISIQSAESALRDAEMTDIDLDAFKAIAGKKVAGGKIPLAAVAYRYAHSELYDRWQLFFDNLGCWHQMYNDLFGWLKDLQNQTPTYFLCEGRRRKCPEHSIAAWVIHEGFAWGMDLLETWLDELKCLAENLHSDELVVYLQYRQQLMEEQTPRLTRTFKTLDRLLAR
jgi:hypothetical protein